MNSRSYKLGLWIASRIYGKADRHVPMEGYDPSKQQRVLTTCPFCGVQTVGAGAVLCARCGKPFAPGHATSMRSRVELSQEERRQIFEEEKARREAQQKIKADEKKKANEKVQKGCLGCLGAALLVGIIVCLMSNSNRSHSDTDSAYRQYVGKAAKLAEGGVGVCFGSHSRLTDFKRASSPDERMAVMSNDHFLTVLGTKNPLVILGVWDEDAEVRWQGVGGASSETGTCWIPFSQLEGK